MTLARLALLAAALLPACAAADGLGPVSLDPRLAVRQSYTDNALTASGAQPRRSDFISQLAPQLTAQLPAGRFTTSATYGPSARLYASNADLATLAHQLSARIDTTLAADLLLRTGGSFLYDEQFFGDELRRPYTRDEAQAALQWRRPGHRTGLLYATQAVDFSRAIDRRNSFRSHGLTADASTPLAAGLTALGNLRASVTQRPEVADAAPDSTHFGWAAGAQQHGRLPVDTILKLGMTYHNFGGNAVVRPRAELQARFASGALAADLQARHGLDELHAIDLLGRFGAFRITTEVTAGARYQLTPALSTSARASWRRADFDGPRNDRVVRWRATLQYAWTARLQLQLGVDALDAGSNIAENRLDPFAIRSTTVFVELVAD